MHIIVERKGCPLLGDKKRAERIVTWSADKEPGTRLRTARGAGISLELVAREATPQIYIYFNQEKLRTQLADLGLQKFFLLTRDGISIKVVGKAAEINLLSLPRARSCLWRGDLKQSAPYDALLGMVELGEDAFRFYTKEECPARTELCGPLDALGRGPRTRPVKLLSTRSKNFLLRDALLNRLLKKERGSGVGEEASAKADDQ